VLNTPFLQNKKGEQEKMDRIKKFFKLEQLGSTVSKEVLAGVTTFTAMVYIVFVNPSILGVTGMPVGAVFLATIFSAVVGTLIMGLFANVPYAQAPGMGLNALFTYTVVLNFGFSWQEALGLVFISGLFNIAITVTRVRKSIIKAIPKFLQSAIGGGIGLFIAYIGFLNVGLIEFGAVPELNKFTTAPSVLMIIGLILTLVLILVKVKGAILIGIIATTLIGIPMGVTNLSGISFDIAGPFKELDQTFFAAFDGLGTLFSDVNRLPMAFLAIFAFTLSDVFDTIGTFIGTGRKTGIFTDEDMDAMENSKGFKTKMEKALLADAIATTTGALIGTSNVTTYVESAAGIEVGGKTGLTSVVTSVLFLLMIFAAPIAGIIPGAATAPALIIVGIMMVSSFADVKWEDLTEAIPAFFTVIIMTLAYNITYGIAFGFIMYVVTRIVTNRAKEIHPIIWGSTGIFIFYFVLMALRGIGVL
jgi:AGZA family xanthine/uracil permease-like MFS transporter